MLHMGNKLYIYQEDIDLVMIVSSFGTSIKVRYIDTLIDYEHLFLASHDTKVHFIASIKLMIVSSIVQYIPSIFD